jgi:transketolase
MNTTSHKINEIDKLEKKAKEIRYHVAEMGFKVGPERKAHPGPALSITDILVTLFYNTMNLDPENPKWEERDKFVLSKGHACLSLYAILADLGYFPIKELTTVRRINSILQGHPDIKKTPGIDITAGSLGNGLGLGVGMALGSQLDKKDNHIFVMIGDGELNEGLIWESAASACKYKLNNLTAIIDKNNFQSCGGTEEVMPFPNIVSRWQSFGWLTKEIDGHNFKDIIDGLKWAKQKESQPKVLIANTIKGKGLSFMENDNSWHQKTLSEEQMEIAKQELKTS